MKTIKRHGASIALLLPSVVVLAVFVYGFIGVNLSISLTDEQGLNAESNFVGLDNYFALLDDPTVLSGLILAHLNGYLHDAMTLSIGSGIPKHTAIGIGMWLAIIMAINVWFVIWPNQKRALGIVECDADLKAKSAKTAMLFSRTNTLLSLPMLLTMVAAQNLY